MIARFVCESWEGRKKVKAIQSLVQPKRNMKNAQSTLFWHYLFRFAWIAVMRAQKFIANENLSRSSPKTYDEKFMFSFISFLFFTWTWNSIPTLKYHLGKEFWWVCLMLVPRSMSLRILLNGSVKMIGEWEIERGEHSNFLRFRNRLTWDSTRSSSP